jgi:hypothetical protein
MAKENLAKNILVEDQAGEIAKHAEITEHIEQATKCCDFPLLPLFPRVPRSLVSHP